MLSSIPLPQYNSVKLFQSMFATADANDVAHLQLQEPQFIAAYAQYDQLHGDSQLITPLSLVSEDVKKALDRCYGRLGNKKISPSFIRDLLLDAVPVCPYCGIGETAELDHVLPRSVWPEFTIHVSNLVPACRKCNGSKSDRSFRTSGWSYRHPYFNAALSSKFLSAEAVIKGTNIKYVFSVQHPPGVSEAAYRSVEDAFETFHLARRFANQSVHRLSNRSHKLRQLFTQFGASSVKNYLTDEATSISAARGVNYWEAVLLGDLASSGDYCKFRYWA